MDPQTSSSLENPTQFEDIAVQSGKQAVADYQKEMSKPVEPPTIVIKQPPLYNLETGKVAFIPPSLVGDYIKSGKYAFRESEQGIPVLSLDGKPGTLSGKEANQEIKRDAFKYEPIESQMQRWSQHEYGSAWQDKLNSLGMGAANMATLGLSDLALRHMGVDPYYMKQAREQNDISYFLGGGAFALGGSSLVGGLAKAIGAEGLANIVPMVGAESAAGKVGGLVGEALPVPTTLAGKIAQQMATRGSVAAGLGAAMGAGQSVSEYALGDTKSIGENLLGNVGFGALTGGVLGLAEGALYTAGSSLSKAIRDRVATSEAIQAELESRIASGLGEKPAPPPVPPGMSGSISDDELSQITSRNAHNVEKLQKATPEGIKSGAIKLAKLHDDIGLEVRKAAEEAFGIHRPYETADLLHGADFEKPLAASQEVSNRAKATLKEFYTKPETFDNKGAVSKFRETTKQYLTDLDRAKSSHDIFSATENYRQTLDESLSKKYAAEGRLHGGTKSVLDSVYEVKQAAKEFLNNREIFGVAGERREQFNRAYSEFKAADKERAKLFGRKQSAETGFTRAVGDPGKYERYLTSLTKDKAAAEVGRNTIKRYLTAVSNLGDQIGKSADSYGAKAELRGLKQIHSKYEQTIGKEAGYAEAVGHYNTEMSKYSDAAKANKKEWSAYQKAEKEYQKQFKNNGKPDGDGYSGAVGAAYKVARAIGLVPGGNINLFVRAMRFLEGTNQTTSKMIEKATEGFMKASIAAKPLAIKKSIEYYSRNHLDGEMDYGRHEKGSKYADRLKALEQLIYSPEAMVGRIRDNLKALEEVAPDSSNHAMMRAVQAASFLYSKAPKNPFAEYPMSSAAQSWRPNNVELAKWSKYFAAVDDPSTVFDQLRGGIVPKEGIEALKNIYPSMYESFLKGLHGHIMENPNKVNYQKKLQLYHGFGISLDPSLAPGFSQTMQQVDIKNQQQNQAVQQQEAQNISKFKSDRSDRMKTDTEKSVLG